jgi:hypothetical protein
MGSAVSFFTTMLRPASCARSSGSVIDVFHFQARQMIGHHVARFREPEQGDLRQDLSLEGNGIGQHHVEGRQAVGGDDEQMLGVHVVNIAHLSLVDFLETAQLRVSNSGADCENCSMCGRASDCYHYWPKVGDCGGPDEIGQREWLGKVNFSVL